MTLSVICHNVANMYAEPDDRSECVSQLVLNDMVQVLEEQPDWFLVEGHDGYQGWVRQEHLSMDSESLTKTNAKVCVSQVLVHWSMSKPLEPALRLTLGTKLFFVESYKAPIYGVRFPRKQKFMCGYVKQQDTLQCDFQWRGQQTVEKMIHMAKECCVGVPYLWGGTTTFGFDCSGLTQRLYGLWDIVLPRDAYQQYESPLGDKLSEGEPYQVGDLVFWVGKSDPRNRGITHVGIMMDKDTVIHAYSKMGVIATPFAEMTSKLGYTYRGAWRYRNEAAE